MLDIEYSLTKMAKQHNVGAELTRTQRLYSLCASARTLVKALGFRALADANHLKPKHATALIQHWQSNGLSSGTVKNNLANLRTWARWIGKPGLFESNDVLGAVKRPSYAHTPESDSVPGPVPKPDARAFCLTPEIRASFHPRMLLVLEMQQAFGLRREEALKLVPLTADKGSYLVLESGWCFRGKPRLVPIRTPEQRAILNVVRAQPGVSLGAYWGNYKNAVNAYERICAKAGLTGCNGLRIHYAQARYAELTGFAAPILTGVRTVTLSPEHRALDTQARILIAYELGSSRARQTDTSLGW